MNIRHLILRECLFRKKHFLLGVAAVAVAVASFAAALVMLALFDRQTERLLTEREERMRVRLAALQDDMRIITRDLGFNLRILPRDLNLVNFYAQDFADGSMPEAYIHKLAGQPLVTVNHLLPTLQKRVDWPEQEFGDIKLVGTLGEVPIADKKQKKPLLQKVPNGGIVLGHQLARQISRSSGTDLRPGDDLVFRGRTFRVHRLHPRKGDIDDVTVWLHLHDAQEMLDAPGRINEILALGCNCSAERLGVIREEIAAILPDTQVEEFETRATARAEARNRVAREEEEGLRQERADREALRGEMTRLTGWLLPAVALAAVVWFALLALGNVLARREEIGIFRALGVGSLRVFVLFLGRALLVGIVGAVVGSILGLAAATAFADSFEEVRQVLALLVPDLVVLVLAAPLVGMAAGWLPALIAVRQDPAAILQEGA